MNIAFPTAFAANAFSVTVLLIAVGVIGRPELAADIGIVQAATLVIFSALSGNARNLALNSVSQISTRFLLVSRLSLLVPAALVSFYLSAGLAMADTTIALCLTLRRCGEWISEIHLSDRELRSDLRFAKLFVVLQGVLLACTLTLIALDHPLSTVSLALWAAVPMIVSLPFIVRQLRFERPGQRVSWGQFMPHLGSTTIIAISVFAFRSLILLLVDKATAGQLYAAFSLGGILPAVFATAIGPSLTFHGVLENRRRVSALFRVLAAVCAVAGAVLFNVSQFSETLLTATGKTSLFWGAVGLSLIGGAVNLFAQRIRLKLLQTDNDNLFGPDVLSNILIIASVPFAFYAIGPYALMFLYLWNSLLTLLFYTSSKQAIKLHRRYPRIEQAAYIVIPLLLCVPVFVQLYSGLFRDPSIYFDSKGMLSRLPIPISLVACYLGILVLGNFRKAYLSLSVIFVSSALLIMATLLSTHATPEVARTKMLLVIQFILPMPALVLGEMYGARDPDQPSFEKAFLFMLCLIVPVQLVATWAQGMLLLMPSVYGFSIYQHLQYVPVVFVSMFILCLFSFCGLGRYSAALCALAPAMGLYATASSSMLALGLMVLGALLLAFQFRKHERRRLAFALCALSLLGTASYFPLGLIKSPQLNAKYRFVAKIVGASSVIERFSKKEAAAVALMPTNLVDRVTCWKFYVRRIAADHDKLLSGHDRPPPRERLPSAHNYYLDYLYNFGLPALVPVLALVAMTLRSVVANRQRIDRTPALFGLTLIVMFLICVDSFLKVGLRQPYPGILGFFLWGVLVRRLNESPTEPPKTDEIGDDIGKPIQVPARNDVPESSSIVQRDDAAHEIAEPKSRRTARESREFKNSP